MTVAQTRYITLYTVFGCYGAQTAERPRMGARCLTCGSSLFEEACETRSWQAMVSHKSPKGATGRFVPMTKPITTGILSSPMKRRPIDRVAARVTLPGINYVPNGRMTLSVPPIASAETPPPVNRPPGKQNLAGMTIGRLTVIRYLGDKVDKEGMTVHSRWLVRCQCGTYELRRARSLRELGSSVDMCHAQCVECQNFAKLRGQKPPDLWRETPIDTVPLLAGANEVFTAGEKFGRLTVVGYGGSSGTGARWVVRCDCGLYGLMRAAGVKKSPMCDRCWRLSQ